MAAPSKDGRSERLARSFKDRLDKLGCPYTEDVADSWITELIFKPGEPRIRLLQWLFSKFDSKLNDVLDPQYASVESKMDSRIQRLLHVATTLGLCRYDDVDLIRGVTSQARQASFMDNLIDLVYIKDAAEDPENKALRVPGIISDAMNLDEQFIKDCKYMDTLVQQERIDSIFRSRLALLPPDLQRQMEIDWADKGHQKDKPPKVDMNELLESANKLAQDLERQKEILQELTKNFKYQEEDKSRKEKVSRTMHLVLSELSQLVVGFTYCYENEISHWCNKSPPALTQLGPAFKRVHNLLQQFVKLLKGFETIRASYTHLTRDAVQDARNSSHLASTGQAMLESFQECVSVLDESIQRHEADCSTTSSVRSFKLKI